MNLLKDLYKPAFLESVRAIVRNWQLLAGSVGAYLLFVLIAILVSPLGLAGGLIAGLAQVILLTYYYSWLEEIARGNRLVWREMVVLDGGLLSAIISVAFILYIISFLAGQFRHSPETASLVPLVNMLMVLVLNAVPEMIYINRYESLHSLSETYNFTRENWIEWYIPFVVVLLPWIALSPGDVLAVISSSYALLPATVLLSGSTEVGYRYLPQVPWLGLLVGIVLANWFMLFRASVFKRLSSSSYRRRR